MKKLILLLLLTTISFTSCEVEQIETDAESQDLFSRMSEESKKGCETAFAFDKKGCFLNDGFNRWGWVIGPLEKDKKSEEYEIYQAAGQCDLSKGEFVGTLNVTYSDGSVTVVYKANPGFEFFETHVYVGNNKYPTLRNGKPTVAPGKYTSKHSYPEGKSKDYYKFDEISGEIYIIAHAVVCFTGKK